MIVQDIINRTIRGPTTVRLSPYTDTFCSSAFDPLTANSRCIDGTAHDDTVPVTYPHRYRLRMPTTPLSHTLPTSAQNRRSQSLLPLGQSIDNTNTHSIVNSNFPTDQSLPELHAIMDNNTESQCYFLHTTRPCKHDHLATCDKDHTERIHVDQTASNLKVDYPHRSTASDDTSVTSTTARRMQENAPNIKG